MSVDSDLNRVQISGSGTITPIAFNRKVFAATDIVGSKEVTATGVVTSLVQGTDYSVTGAGNTSTGATITPLVAPAVGERWVFWSDQANTQASVYTENDRFPAKTTEYALDKQSIGIQDQSRYNDLALRYPDTEDSGTSGSLPVVNDRKSKALGFDANGDISMITVNNVSSSNASGITYDPAGAGAVPATVEAKLREYVSVTDFGADKTGVADSAAAIQAAIDYDQGARGRAIYFPAGTYSVSSNINLDSTNTQFGITLFGDGFNASLITLRSDFSGTGDTNCIFQIDGTGMTTHRKSFKDMSIADNSGYAASGFQAVKLLNGAFENDFTRIWFAGSKTHLYIDQDSLGPIVNDCVFDLATNNSILDESYKPSQISNCIFTSSATSSQTISFDYDTASPKSGWATSFGGSVKDCLFLNEYRCIEFDGNRGMQIEGNKFQVTSADSNKFIIAGSSFAPMITNNIFISSDGVGDLTNECIVLGTTQNGTISNNVFRSIEGAGITLVDADFTTINGNTFSDVQQPCIQFETTQSRGITIDANLFENCGTASTYNVIQGTAGKQTRIFIADNVFEGTLGDYDIDVQNTCYLLDNLYSNDAPATDVQTASFTGVHRYLQVAADANDSISNAAGTDASIIDAIRDELHDLKDKMRTADFLDT